MNRPGSDGPPLLIATRANRIAVVQLLLAHGADVNATDSRTGRTALHTAALDGLSGIASLLITYGANVNALDRTGRTPLSRATQQGTTEIAALLIENGARSDDITPTGIKITGKQTGGIASAAPSALLKPDPPGAFVTGNTRACLLERDQGQRQPGRLPGLSRHLPERPFPVRGGRPRARRGRGRASGPGGGRHRSRSGLLERDQEQRQPGRLPGLCGRLSEGSLCAVGPRPHPCCRRGCRTTGCRTSRPGGG